MMKKSKKKITFSSFILLFPKIGGRSPPIHSIDSLSHDKEN